MRRIATLLIATAIIILTPISTASADYLHCTQGNICFRSPGVDTSGVHDLRP